VAESFLLKGILIGLLFGIPVRAVVTMAAQRTFSLGFGAGLKMGLGSSAADCFYAVCGAFGITFVSELLNFTLLRILCAIVNNSFRFAWFYATKKAV